ncbi:MAG: hypothetical protein KatS3mg060_3579 [Dehalococcoidia bacterium]|nr:MAG: hypothetical protein KatS3mg060_3579 [Dehalococcoidia bacterium]
MSLHDVARSGCRPSSPASETARALRNAVWPTTADQRLTAVGASTSAVRAVSTRAGNLLTKEEAVVLPAVMGVDLPHIRQPDIRPGRFKGGLPLTVAAGDNWLGKRGAIDHRLA